MGIGRSVSFATDRLRPHQNYVGERPQDCEQGLIGLSGQPGRPGLPGRGSIERGNHVRSDPGAGRVGVLARQSVVELKGIGGGRFGDWEKTPHARLFGRDATVQAFVDPFGRRFSHRGPVRGARGRSFPRRPERRGEELPGMLNRSSARAVVLPESDTGPVFHS